LSIVSFLFAFDIFLSFETFVLRFAAITALAASVDAEGLKGVTAVIG
jgi:hypothetical protein